MAGVVQVRQRIVVMMTGVYAVGARLRLERRLGLGDGASEATCHLGQHVVGLEAQTAAAGLGNDLHRYVAIAQVVGGAREEQGCAGNGLDQ